MKRRKTARLHITMPEEDVEALRALSRRADVPMSALVRRLLRHAMPRWKESLDADRLALLASGDDHPPGRTATTATAPRPDF